MSITDRLTHRLLKVAIWRLRQQLCPPFVEAARNPKQTQQKVLQQIIDTNVETDFGRRHGFSSIKSEADFRRAVPIQNYESLHSYITAQEEEATAALTVEPPVLYAQTSGTSGSPKYLPLTESGIERIKRSQRMFTLFVATQTNMLSGKIVAIGSPAVEGHLPGGTPFGSASGVVYEKAPRLVRSKYVVGPEVLAMEHHDTKYLAIAALALTESNVTGFATANPSTLLRLHSVILEHFDVLVASIEHGELRTTHPLSEPQQQELARSLSANANRANHLRSLHLEHKDDITFEHFWPNLSAITTWTGGSCGFATSSLQKLTPPTTHIMELGYSASEMRGAIGVDVETNDAAPLITDNWFEFVERRVREDQDSPPEPEDFLGLHEIELDQQYYVYVTTFDGLYRYDMNDIIEVTGFFENAPCISFVQKGQGVTNITGEKISESQMRDAVTQAQKDLNLLASSFIALANEQDAHYELYFEHDGQETVGTELAQLVDQKLAELNMEYQTKRASKRLGPLAAFDLTAGTFDAYRSQLTEAGQRDAQFKYLQIQNAAECPFDFSSHVRTAGTR